MAVKAKSEIESKAKETLKEVKPPALEAAAPPIASPATSSTSAPAKSSNKSCITCAAIGCGCLALLAIILVIVLIVGGIFVKKAANEAISGSPKTQTGVPTAVVDIIDRFAGKSEAGQNIIKILKQGVTDDMLKGASGVNKNTEVTPPGSLNDTPIEEWLTPPPDNASE